MSLTQGELHELIDFTRHLAMVSGEEIKKYFATPELHVRLKPDQSPVTAADIQAERMLRDIILKRYPAHGIIGEEFGTENESAEFVWVLDPIDGTISFASGCPLFGTLICLQYQGQPIIGAIHQPILGQLLIGSPAGTTMNGRAVMMPEQRTLSAALLLTTDLDNIARYQSIERFSILRERTKILRTWGDCYGYVLVAMGGAHIMTDPIMNPWDLQALIPVIRGAGGIISAWDGTEASGATSCVAAPCGLHDQVIAILNE
jgi:myo-inositol-1(or 4)-monophosphatase